MSATVADCITRALEGFDAIGRRGSVPDRCLAGLPGLDLALRQGGGSGNGDLGHRTPDIFHGIGLGLGNLLLGLPGTAFDRFRQLAPGFGGDDVAVYPASSALQDPHRIEDAVACLDEPRQLSRRDG